MLSKTFLPDLDAPVPVSAVWSPIGPKLVVSFSTQLEVGFFDKNNWFVRYGGMSYPLVHALAGLTKVDLLCGSPLSNPGPAVVSYSPPPFDIVSAPGGVPAPAFSDYPIP